jgi:hypothetical protein
MYYQKCSNLFFFAYIPYFDTIKADLRDRLAVCMSVYSHLSLLGNGSVNTSGGNEYIRSLRRIVLGVVFYPVLAVSKKSR